MALMLSLVQTQDCLCYIAKITEAAGQESILCAVAVSTVLGCIFTRLQVLTYTELLCEVSDVVTSCEP